MYARFALISIIILLPAATRSSAAMHTRLTKAEPGVGAVVTTAPTQVRLWFSEAPVLPFTAVSLLRSDSTVVAKLTMAATEDKKSVSGAIPVALVAGEYIVSWRTASDDGHPARGKFQFTYKPN
jgi:methionine-rich copper-binding protein CopC